MAAGFSSSQPAGEEEGGRREHWHILTWKNKKVRQHSYAYLCFMPQEMTCRRIPFCRQETPDQPHQLQHLHGCLRSRQSLARSAIPPEAIGVQMAGGQMCAAFELTFSVRHEGLFKVWIVKLCWLGRVQQNVSKYKMIFLLSFSFLCRLDTGTLLLMLVTRQSLSSVGTGRKELFALNTALSAGARGTEWRCLTFMDNFDRLHGWWFVMDGHWVMPCALRSGYPIAWADQVQVFQLQVLYHFVVFSEVQ